MLKIKDMDILDIMMFCFILTCIILMFTILAVGVYSMIKQINNPNYKKCVCEKVEE